MRNGSHMTGSNRVEGKVALVTGAASGLGLASAIKLLDEGAKVFFSDINDEGLEKLNQILVNYNSDHYSIGHHDVSSEQSWNDVLEKVNSKFVIPHIRKSNYDSFISNRKKLVPIMIL